MSTTTAGSAPSLLERVGMRPFDDLAALAAQLCGAPAAAIHLIDIEPTPVTIATPAQASFAAPLRAAAVAALSAANGLAHTGADAAGITTCAVAVETPAGERLGALAVGFAGPAADRRYRYPRPAASGPTGRRSRGAGALQRRTNAASRQPRNRGGLRPRGRTQGVVDGGHPRAPGSCRHRGSQRRAALSEPGRANAASRARRRRSRRCAICMLPTSGSRSTWPPCRRPGAASGPVRRRWSALEASASR